MARRSSARALAAFVLALPAAALGAGGEPAAPAAVAGPAGAPVAAVRLAGLSVTTGRLRELAPGRLAVDDPELRAVHRGTGGARAELRFRYLGAPASIRPLASGEARRQIGLKLRARDDCNLLYAMWRASPPAVVVQVKRNPDARTHGECGAGGYRRLAGERSSPVASFEDGREHVLAAELAGGALRVTADGAVVWAGALPPDAAALAGPAGLRSDNGRFELELRIGEAARVR